MFCMFLLWCIAQVVRFLCGAGADVNQVVCSNTYTHHFNHTHIHQFKVASCGVHHNMTPLHTAAFLGYVDIASILITAGAELNIEGSELLWSPLQMAASKGHSEVVHLLCEAFADISKADQTYASFNSQSD